MADTRNPKEVVDIGKFQPYDHPEYGPGAVREITYIDGTIERRFFYHGTQKEGEGAPDSGYLVDTKVDPKLRAAYDQNRPAGPAQRTPEQQRADAANAASAEAKAAEEARIRNESAWNADPANRANGGSGRYEDHATRDARLAKESTDAEARARQAKIDEQNAANTADNNKRADAEAAQRAAQANKPDVRLTQDGTQAVITYPDGRIETKATGLASAQDIKQDKDGNWVATGKDAQGNPTVRIVPVQGQTASPNAGLSAPQIILGHSKDALTSYGNSLQAEVAAGRMTQARADTLWTQAHQTAQVAIQEATLAQNEAESSRNAQVNLANNRLSNSTSGFNAALAAVDKINGTLPEGSDLGGKAFIAMLGLQMGQAQRMGAYDVSPIAGPRSPNAEALDSTNAPVMGTAQTQLSRLTAPQPPAASPVAPGAPPVAVTAPAASAVTPALAATGPVTPPSPPLNDQPDTSTLRQVPDASGGPPTYVSPDGKMYSYVNGAMVMVGVNSSAYQTATPWAPMTTGDDPNAVGRAAPANDYPVLADAAPMPSPAFAPPVLPNQMSPGAPLPAVMHAQAASKPFWQMSADEVAQYQAAGVPDDVIFGAPRVAA